MTQVVRLALLLASVFALAAGPRAPLPADRAAEFSHAPFEVGDCTLCHERDDPDNPGAVVGAINQLCFGCHDDLQDALAEASVAHAPALDSCTNCHNPHNSTQPKLLIEQPTALCGSCHDEQQALAINATVKHGALSDEAGCLNCHDPHASNVEMLLHQLPYNLCVTCHSGRELRDEQGNTLTDFGELLAANPVRHGPVESKDCSACHQSHGGENFRMLTMEYPATFYAPFDPDNYALCFACHSETIVTEPTTTTQTGFRDGDRNLHFLHVNKSKRGRTCRACHEVHAAEQAHIIRDGVPYGSSGWILSVNYQATSTGGTCAKTCHPAKSYDRSKSP